MSYYLFAVLANAQTCQSKVDAALNMPLAGKDVGGGVHAPPSQSATTTYFAPAPHPLVANTWIYPADAVAAPILSVGPTDVLIGVPQTVTFPSAIT